jgi:hypothetical protein
VEKPFMSTNGKWQSVLLVEEYPPWFGITHEIKSNYGSTPTNNEFTASYQISHGWSS